MKSRKSKPKMTIDDRVKLYYKGEVELLEKAGLTKRLIVLFPKRKHGAPSLFGAILLWLLRLQGGILDTEYKLKK